jgi:hypothetical protein
MPAGSTWRYHDGLGFRGQGGRQGHFADGHAQIIVLLLEAERARHAAAARIQYGRLQTRHQPERGNGS